IRPRPVTSRHDPASPTAQVHALSRGEDAEMAATHFTSDTHFRHRLMARQRGYALGSGSADDVTEEQITAHDEAIVAAWNRHVRPEDTVWHLGDLSLVAPRRLAGIVPRLNGRIRLVLGNHDRAHPLFGEKSIEALRATMG